MVFANSESGWAHRFHLQNRMFIFISFLPKKFFLPGFQFRLFSLFILLLERLLNDIDASTFVLMFCSPFILHYNPNSSFDFINKTMKPTSIVWRFQIIWPIRGGSLDKVPAVQTSGCGCGCSCGDLPRTRPNAGDAADRRVAQMKRCAWTRKAKRSPRSHCGELSDSTPATTKWTRTSPGPFP